MATAELFGDLIETLRHHSVSIRQKGAPMYAGLAALMVDDPELLALMAHARAGQPADFALFTAVNHLLLTDPDAPLARLHPLTTRTPMEAGAIYPALRAYALEHAARIRALIATRTVQYTTTLRSSYVLPAMDYVAHQAGEPLSLVEIGCSVGLNLLFDQWSYDYGTAGRIDTPGSRVRVRGEFRGAAPKLPARMPLVGARVGLDLHRMHFDDEDAQRWILASLWPEWIDDVQALEQALPVRRTFPLEVVEGDALETLPGVIDRLPDPVCVFHSAVLYQWNRAQIARLEALLDRIGRERTVHRIAIETLSLTMTTVEAERVYREGGYVPVEIRHTRYDARGPQSTLLGYCDGFGKWLEWKIGAA
ncbi:MAG: DUF2332 domain-containing protein [Gammaproteobacteria bacterium]